MGLFGTIGGIAGNLIGGSIGGSIGGAIGGYLDIGQTAGAQQAGIRDAQGNIIAGRQAAIGAREKYYGEAKAGLRPYMEAGTEALKREGSILEQLAGGMTGQQLLEEDPGYQFRKEEGQRALEASMAGRRLGGRAAKEAIRYGSGVAAQEYGAAYQRKGSLADRFRRRAEAGQSAATTTGGWAMGTGAGIAGDYTGAASNLANLSLGRGQVEAQRWGDIGDLATTVGSAYMKNKGYGTPGFNPNP